MGVPVWTLLLRVTVGMATFRKTTSCERDREDFAVVDGMSDHSRCPNRFLAVF